MLMSLLQRPEFSPGDRPCYLECYIRLYIRSTYFHYSRTGYFNHMGSYPISDRSSAEMLNKLLKNLII